MAFCTYCGKDVSDAAAACPNCGHPRGAPLVQATAPVAAPVAAAPLGAAAPVGAAGPRTEGTAIASLILGIAGFVVCPVVCHILAVILGNQARSKIRLDPTLEGDGMAKAGVILGWIGIGLTVLVIVGAVLAIVTGNMHRYYGPSI